MTRAWPMLVLAVLLGWQANAGVAQQLQVKEKSSVKMDPKNKRFQSVGETVALSPDGKTLAFVSPWSSSDEGVVLVLCDTTTGGVTMKRHSGVASAALAFNADGTMLAVGTKVRREAKSQGRPSLFWDDVVVTLWDMKTRKQSAILRLPHASLNHMAFSPNGKELALATGLGSRACVSIWEVATGKERAELYPGGWPLYSPDGKLHYPGGGLWNTDTEEQWAPPGPLGDVLRSSRLGRPMAFSPPDEKLLATVEGPNPQSKRPGQIKFWDMKTGNEQRVIELRWGTLRYEEGKTPRELMSPTFSPDGKLLGVEEEGGIGLYAVESGKRLATAEGGRFPFVFSRDGKTLTGLDRDDRTIKVWELTWEKEPGK